MRTAEGTASVLFGRARRNVLGWLVTHLGDEYFLTELARRARLAPSTAQRELNELVKAGLVTRSKSGHQVYFAANEASPVFREVQSLLIKTSAMADVLRHALRPLTKRIDAAFLVGAAATGDLRRDAPVEMRVVGDVEPREVVAVLSRACRALGRRITVKTQPDGADRPVNEPHVSLLDKKLDTAFPAR